MRKLILVGSNDLPAQGVYGRDLDIKQYQKQLGITQGDIFWDANAGLYPNAFAAIAGTIKDSHNLYLHLPKHYPNGDPDHWRMMDYGRPITLAKPHFNERFRRLISTIFASDEQTPTPTAAAFSNQPQIILGKRGRGKSTWLAQKMQWLNRCGEKTFLLVSTFAAHRQRILSLLPKNFPLITLPPDEACRLNPKVDYLIIDEAASLPAEQLMHLITCYPDFSLASSEDGYEGNARFFSLQTLPTLQKNIPSLEIITLYQGQRFSANDVLEQLIDWTFFARTSLATLNDFPKSSSKDEFSIQALTQAQLIQNEPLLTSIYQLLFLAHYRTRPDDLKRLLDLPDQYLYVAFTRTKPVAVIQVLIEHPLPATLAADIISKKRRPQGRLLMQQLLIHTQQTAFALQPLARIQRIVTHPDYRRQGLASRLITHVTQALPYRLGVSYGATDSLETFWKSQGFITYFRNYNQYNRHGRQNIIQLYKY